MSGAMSKRQQARNEKALYDLVQNVPGNNFCADCGARNPVWASWSLGVFLCMRCAAIHRKLGTHVSKVKSLSMDSWSNEQVENMKKVGNITSNKSYNPSNKIPPVPIDADEADSAMERFIRQKYTSNQLVAGRRHNTGSTESDETPPPLPPKTPSRFGFRAATSIFPIGSKAKKTTSSRDPPSSPRELPSPHRNKPSQVFGASVPSDRDDVENKLARLRDMGFSDDRRNLQVMKGVNGNLERTIEALVRLGEGDGRSSASLVSPRESSVSINRSLTPATSVSAQDASRGRPITPSTNPFDMLDMPPAQPMSSQSTGTLPNRNPFLASTPFGLVTQQSHSALNQAFQSMALSPAQPLFPHHTGGQAMVAQQQNPQALYQQPGILGGAQNQSSMGFSSHQTYPLPSQQPATGAYNPFFANSAQAPQQGLSVNTVGAPGSFANNPFARSPTRIQSPSLNQIPEQSQQNFYTASPTQLNNPFFSQAGAQTAAQQPGLFAQQPTQQSSPFGQQPLQQSSPFAQQQAQQTSPFAQQPAQPSPFAQQPSPFAMQQPAQQGYFQQQQQQQQQPAARPQADTASIMALFNQPPAAQPTAQAAAPNPFLASGQALPQSQAPPAAPNGHQLFQSQTFPMASNQQPQYAATGSALASGNNNPFFASAGRTETGQQPALLDLTPNKHNASRDSMMARGLDWSNGRHSPDAFASLSARDMR